MIFWGILLFCSSEGCFEPPEEPETEICEVADPAPQEDTPAEPEDSEHPWNLDVYLTEGVSR